MSEAEIQNAENQTPSLQFRVVCGNPKCRKTFDNPPIEFNFFTKEVSFYCLECKHSSRINLEPKAQSLPRMRRLS